MTKKFSGVVVLFLCAFSAQVSANGIKEMSQSDFTAFDLNNLSDKSGVVATPKTFHKAAYKNTADGKDIPKFVQKDFDASSNLIIHQVAFKIPKEYKSFTAQALKDRKSIQENLLHNSEMQLDNDNFAACPEVNGVLNSGIDIPGILSAFNFPDKLICNVSLANVGTGKKNLRKELLVNLPADLKDEDVRSVTMNLSQCNMIFKSATQNIHFIKAKDGKTLMVFDNYSLVKSTTLEKLESVRLFTGGSVKFINGQVKKNMSGLLKYINSPNKN